MKPSGGEKRLGSGQNDLDRLGLGTGANMSPQIAQCLQKESSNLSTLTLSIKRKATITRYWGPQWSGRSLFLGVSALVEEFVPMITLSILGSQRAFTLTISHEVSELVRDC